MDDLLRGAMLGLGMTGTNLTRGVGAIQGLGGLRDWADTTDQEMTQTYDPQGTWGMVGTGGGRLAGELATMFGGGGAVAKGLGMVAPKVAATLQGLKAAPGVVKPALGYGIPMAPVASISGAGNAPEDPGRGAALNMAYNLPLVGDALSAVDAVRGVGGAAKAASAGDRGEATKKLLLSALAGAGALPMLGYVGPLFHGSPHLWDRPSRHARLSGEGANVYGAADLYAAESKPTGEWYWHELTKNEMAKPPRTLLDGQEVEGDMLLGHPRLSNDENDFLYRKVYLHGQPRAHLSRRQYLQLLKESWEDVAMTRQLRPHEARELDIINGLLPRVGELPRERPGALYELDLPTSDVDDFIHWDIPFEQQPQRVQDILRRVAPGAFDDATQPGEIYQRSQNLFGEDPSQVLRDAGIKGNRYLDGNSRGRGEGSYNYAIFDGNDIRILKRNEKILADLRASLGLPGDP